MTSITPEPIIQTALGFMASKYLFIASEVGLFAALADGPLTAEDLARRLGMPHTTTRIVLDAVAALGFVQRHDDLYENSPPAATFLSGRTPADLRPFLRLCDTLVYPMWQDLRAAVRGTPEHSAEMNAEQQRIFSEGVEALTAGSARALAASYDFGGHRRLLDLGGGTGFFLRAVLSQHPWMRGTLFESPAVAALARQRLDADPEAARVDVVEGDFLSAPLPDGHDLVLLANVVHLFAPERNRALLGRIRAAVSAQARLLLVDFWTDPSHTQPLAAALLAGEFRLVTGEGDVYSVEELQPWLEATGWRFIAHHPLAGAASLVVAEAT